MATLCVENIAELEALSTINACSAVVRGRTSSGDGYSGLFVWASGDQSLLVASDPQQGVWVAPSSDSDGSSGAWRRISERPDHINVQTLGALGNTNYSVDNAPTGADDTDAIQAAIDLAEDLIDQLKAPVTVYFPGGVYGISDVLQISRGRIRLTCEVPGSAEIYALHNGVMLHIGTDSTKLYDGRISNLKFVRRSPTFNATKAIEVGGTANAAGGASHWKFSDLSFDGVDKCVFFEDSGVINNGGSGVTSGHAFCQIRNLDVSLNLDARYPSTVVEFAGPPGPHHIIEGGHYRARDAGILVDLGSMPTGICGDLQIANLQIICVPVGSGDYGIKLVGGSNAHDGTLYTANTTIVGVDIDGQPTIAPIHLENLAQVYVSGCAGAHGYTITNCRNYIVWDGPGLRSQSTNFEWDVDQPVRLKSYLYAENSSVFSGLVSVGKLRLGESGALTLNASGAITVTGSRHTVDTYLLAASDDLLTISGGAEGDDLQLSLANSARDVTLKHGVGNIRLDGRTDKVLSSVSDIVRLTFVGGNWVQVSYSDNAA